MWLVALSAGIAVAAALVVWHEVGRNRQLGFMLLKQYEELLAQSREEKAREAERAAQEEAEARRKALTAVEEAAEEHIAQ